MAKGFHRLSTVPRPHRHNSFAQCMFAGPYALMLAIGRRVALPREDLFLDACVLHIHETIICDSDLSVLSKVIQFVRTKSQESVARLMFLS